MKKSVLVTGASSGIGLATAQRLARDGWQVFGTSRTAAFGEVRDGLMMLPMNVDEEASVNDGIAWVLEQGPRLDAVVSNAGWSLVGPLEETTDGELQAQLNTHLLGPHRLVRAVLPAMRAQNAVGGKRAHLVFVGSIAGRIGLPFQGAYSASKFALAGWAQSLRLELVAFDIRVTLVEPGDVRTGFSSARRFTPAHSDDSHYREALTRALNVTLEGERTGPPPSVVADAIADVLATSSPPPRQTVGCLADRVSAWAADLLPDRLAEALKRKFFDVS
ncbi:MAG: SDR family oxidoreductase [Bacteroidota bacterium]